MANICDQKEAMNEEVISGTTIPPTSSIKRPTNACTLPHSNYCSNSVLLLTVTELMSKKPKPHSKPAKTQSSHRQHVYAGRDGLGAYTADPDAFPRSRVIYHNDRAVVINDMYPKSTVHTLVLLRSPRNTLHPFQAFEDAKFLAETKEEVEKAKVVVANELRRLYGKFSKSEKPRLEAMESDDPPDELPPGRDWSKDVVSGVHAGPSMNHLHVHVMSRDMVSECLKKTGHYQSFTTPFLVHLDEFPLAEDDVRRNKDRGGYLHDALHCWRCGKEFGRLSILKSHLQDEFEQWKRE